jgi:hypothetical protein
MSDTELYWFNRRGKLELHAAFENAFRGAMAIWTDLAKTYLFGDGYMRDYQPVWNLARSERLEEFERITLMTTFDWVVVRNIEIARVVAAFKSFHHKYPQNHLDQQAIVLGSPKIETCCLGICWNQTSVNADAWLVEGKRGDLRPYNLLRDTGHWFLFDQLSPGNEAQ